MHDKDTTNCISTANNKALLTIKFADIITAIAAPRKLIRFPLLYSTPSSLPISTRTSYSTLSSSCPWALIQTAGG